MKIENNHIVCEKCGKRGPTANLITEMMKSAVQDFGWGYEWEHTQTTHIAHFYCSVCKLEFNTIDREDIPQ